MEIDYLQLAAAKHGAKKEDLLASFVNDERAVIVLPSGKKFTYSCAELVREAELYEDAEAKAERSAAEAAAGEAGKASPKPAQRSTAAKRSRSAKK